MSSEPDRLRGLDDALAGPDPWQGALRWALARTETMSGTLHLVEDDGHLHLVAHENIPPPVLELVQRIPIGKGMAGLAAERREPVSLCNLQTDDSGDARPGARATGLRGTIAVPLFGTEEPDAPVVGTLGVGREESHEFGPAEAALLIEAGRRIAQRRGAEG